MHLSLYLLEVSKYSILRAATTAFSFCVNVVRAELNLDYIVDNPWMIIPCSALKTINVEEIIQWLIKEADKPSKR